MRARPSCLLQAAGGEANRILLASALSSMRIICPNRVSWCDWIIAVSLCIDLLKCNCSSECVSRYYTGIGLSCVLLLLVAFMYLGLCFGACGETAGHEAGLCNRGTGACLLLMYVTLSSLSLTLCLSNVTTVVMIVSMALGSRIVLLHSPDGSTLQCGMGQGLPSWQHFFTLFSWNKVKFVEKVVEFLWLCSSEFGMETILCTLEFDVAEWWNIKKTEMRWNLLRSTIVVFVCLLHTED